MNTLKIRPKELSTLHIIENFRHLWAWPKYVCKDWGPKKVTIYFPIFYLVKSSENIFLPAFYLIMWLMKLSKNFEKIAILKIGELVSFLGVKIHFGKK